MHSVVQDADAYCASPLSSSYPTFKDGILFTSYFTSLLDVVLHVACVLARYSPVACLCSFACYDTSVRANRMLLCTLYTKIQRDHSVYPWEIYIYRRIRCTPPNLYSCDCKFMVGKYYKNQCSLAWILLPRKHCGSLCGMHGIQKGCIVGHYARTVKMSWTVEYSQAEIQGSGTESFRVAR